MRLRAYAIGVGLAFASVPLVHLYLTVDLSVAELLLHAADIALTTALGIALAEAVVSGLQRSVDWRFEGVRGVLGLAGFALLALLPWAVFGMHDLLPQTQAIRQKHVASGYADISLRILPLTALIFFLAYQALRLSLMRRELQEQRAVNAGLEARWRGAVEPAPRSRVLLVNESGELSVDPVAILRVQAQENYCEFVLRDDPPRLVRMTLAEAEALLPDDLFVRTHRSHLANLAHVHELVREGRQAALRLRDGEQVPIARSRAAPVRERVREHLAAGAVG